MLAATTFASVQRAWYRSLRKLSLPARAMLAATTFARVQRAGRAPCAAPTPVPKSSSDQESALLAGPQLEHCSQPPFARVQRAGRAPRAAPHKTPTHLATKTSAPPLRIPSSGATPLTAEEPSCAGGAGIVNTLAPPISNSGVA